MSRMKIPPSNVYNKIYVLVCLFTSLQVTPPKLRKFPLAVETCNLDIVREIFQYTSLARSNMLLHCLGIKPV